jgi:hypothetical protein
VFSFSRKEPKLKILLLCLLTFFCSVAGRACDLCGCYTPQENTMAPEAAHLTGFYGAVAEQFTSFGTLQFEGRKVGNPTGQYLNSAITQLVAGYDLTSRFALQTNVPIIYRDFKRPEGFAIDRGNISGLGDVTLLLKTVAFHYASAARRTFLFQGKNPVAVDHEPDFAASAILLTGLKLPTGATGRLKEEFHEVEIPGAPKSGIHGHDLTLGTGSYDGIFGEQTSIRYRSLFFEGNIQFTLRGDGAHQYHFANDLTWAAGPGYYVVRRADTMAGLQFDITGEHKDVDRFRGKPAEDTRITSIFVGPRIIAARGRLSAELAVDLPVLINNTALQAVPDYRLRGGIAVQF